MAININNLSVCGEGLPLVIAGPCVLEDAGSARDTAGRLKEICSSLGLPFVFKSSFDKANRSSLGSFRGPGMAKGLRILADIKTDLNIPVLSDIHTVDEVGPAAEVLDVLQIPAFLCRQTDLILAASRTGRPVNIKKGQFLAPWDMSNIIDKFISTGNKSLMLTERGSSFGYNNLVVDFRSFPIMRAFGYPVIFDVTHSLQLPGGQGGSSGGQREFAGPFIRAAAALGVDGFFLEVHPEPEKALCDGPNMVRLDDLQEMLRSMVTIVKALRKTEVSLETR
ncbi:MAG: 3-deoxy-8-phosphooctulonate synthase [Thermodesulfovibrio sp.]|nr:3-deoxy-8-phosphooctulonate synthase [Thermodesulfovibrio sp.]